MSTDLPAPPPPCTPQCRPPRHSHYSPDLDATGITCGAGHLLWGILHGGPLPAKVVCLVCLAQGDLEQLLMRTGRGR
jgi:hypothetical protein